MIAELDGTGMHHLERLARIIRAGECVLFLGAGVSIDSGAPSGQMLADEIGAKFFELKPGAYSLNELGELVDANFSRKELNEFLRHRFNELEPAGALAHIPLFKWKSIYTVNFDTLLEQAYAKCSGRLQDLQVFYSNRDSLGRLRIEDVALYKLHGCLSRSNTPDGRLTLTQRDFAKVDQSRKRLFRRLFDDASDFTVLYVGFRRRDHDFTRILVEVESAAGGLSELQWSYALQPNFTDFEARASEGNRITLIDATAEQFFLLLSEALPPERRTIEFGLSDEVAQPILVRKPQLSADALVDVERDFEVLDERIHSHTPNPSGFFEGAQPNWGTIAANVDASRDITDSILETVLQDPHLDQKEAQFLLIHSEAGTGKTTLLRRLGVEIALTWGRIVVSLKPYGSLNFHAIERLARTGDERVYVLIDEATDRARDISTFLATANHSKTKITVLATARTNEWREIQEDYTFPGTEEFELERLSRSEILSLIQTLQEHNALGYLNGLSSEAMIEAFESRAEKQLLVALREATEGKSFDDIVVDEFDRIPTLDGQRAYLIVAALHRLGILTRAGLLHRILNIPLLNLGSRVFDPTTKVIVAHDGLVDQDQHYATRHQLIADIVFDRKTTNERRRLDVYMDIIQNLDVGYASDQDAYRKLTRVHNKELLRGLSEHASRREIMQQLIALDPDDAAVHQHAAMMELDSGCLNEASKHLRKAIELHPDNPAIRDTEGRIALQRAVAETNEVLANSGFERAEDIFARNIQRSRSQPFGYRHLADTYISWAERQSSVEKTLELYKRAYEVLLDGLDSCSSTAMLLQKLGELEQVLGNVDQARDAFSKALQERPGDRITRFMAARLEEREGYTTSALELLKGGLNTNPADRELRYRVATLMSAVAPDCDQEIRGHFEAAVLGPLRNFQPRMAYGAYLFSKGEYDASLAQFRRLDDLAVPSRERFMPRRFAFGKLKDRQQGRIAFRAARHGFVEFDQAAVSLFFSIRDLPWELVRMLDVGRTIRFDIRFNFKGPIASRLEVFD